MQNKAKLFYYSITVSLAGFLFGIDTAVISGADKPIQELWQTSTMFHSIFIMSMALWGTVVGAIFGGIPTDRLGRKKTLVWIGVLYVVSALGVALAPEPYTFSFFRFIGGLAIGASSVAAPAYISEIATAERRGRLVALYQFNIVFGILCAYLSNYLLGLAGIGGENSWRWMLGIVALPSVAYLVMVLGVPESPRWLILHKKDDAAGRKVLQELNPGIDANAELAAIKNSVNVVQKTERLFDKKFRLPVMLAFLIAAFNQLSGINFVIYYSPRIFEAAGLGADTALLSSVGIGVVNLVFTMLGVQMIDRFGRKKLMLIGSIGYIVTLSLVSWAFFAKMEGFYVVLFLFGFIASHAIGQGAVIWVFLSEIFPNSVRAAGQSLGSSTHWVFAALITLFTLPIVEMFDNSPAPLFAIFAGFMVLQLLFVLFMMPETKGVPLEEIEKRLVKK